VAPFRACRENYSPDFRLFAALLPPFFHLLDMANDLIDSTDKQAE
jgi:hypothetical protein